MDHVIGHLTASQPPYACSTHSAPKFALSKRVAAGAQFIVHKPHVQICSIFADGMLLCWANNWLNRMPLRRGPAIARSSHQSAFHLYLITDLPLKDIE